MKKTFLFIVIVLFFTPSVARSQLLAEFNHYMSNCGTLGVGESLQLLWQGLIQINEYSYRSEKDMFWDNVPSTGSGMTFRIDHDTENFSYFASRFTNGIDDKLGIFARILPWHGYGAGGEIFSEKQWLTLRGHKYYDNNSDDLLGAEITHIDMYVNSISFVSPGSDLAGNGLWTDYDYSVQYYIYGVPEPTTLSLLVLGGLAILRKRK